MLLPTTRQWKPVVHAVYGYLLGYDGVEPSWDKEARKYRAEASVADWFNGRERGFVLTVSDARHKVNVQHFIVYEHRNSDQICCLHYEVPYTVPSNNPPTMPTLPKGLFECSDDYTMEWRYDKAYDAAQWIMDTLNEIYAAPVE